MRTVISPVIEEYSDPRDIANAFSNNVSNTFRADFVDINEISGLRKDVLYSSECQFGFKKGHFTNLYICHAV